MRIYKHEIQGNAENNKQHDKSLRECGEREEKKDPNGIYKSWGIVEICSSPTHQDSMQNLGSSESYDLFEAVISVL